MPTIGHTSTIIALDSTGGTISDASVTIYKMSHGKIVLPAVLPNKLDTSPKTGPDGSYRTADGLLTDGATYSIVVVDKAGTPIGSNQFAAQGTAYVILY